MFHRGKKGRSERRKVGEVGEMAYGVEGVALIPIGQLRDPKNDLA